jgi:spore maturation protein CgeB
MRFIYFTHSLVSDWNHGNAHFLRGIVRELTSRGHEVQLFEPRDSWSLQNLITDQGTEALARFTAAFPGLRSVSYDLATLDLDRALDGADVVIVHEWNDHDLVARIGRKRANGARFHLLFHDTHHRSVSDPKSMAAYDLSAYDGVLAYGAVIREIYLSMGWGKRAWTWHEAADTALFRPLPARPREGDLVWIGNWGDGERSVELGEFLLLPIRQLRLKARIHGVRYPAEAKAAVSLAGAEYAGYLPNHEAPEAFARFAVTVHVPRRPYVELLRGIPTIRPFEAMACGIPLVCSPWDDAEGLFRPGNDYLIAHNGAEMTKHLRDVLNDLDLSAALARSGYETIQARHTCAHRVDELLGICRELKQANPLLLEAR